MELRRPSRERWNNPSALKRVGPNSGPNGLLGSHSFRGASRSAHGAPGARKRDLAGDSRYTPAPFEEGLPDGRRRRIRKRRRSRRGAVRAGRHRRPRGRRVRLRLRHRRLDDVDVEDDVLVGDDSDDVVVDEEAEDEEDEVVDLEEELHPDDVEEPLDVLLLERTSSGLLDEDEYEEEDDDSEADDRADPGSRIPPKRPGEFVCRSCFLVKHPSQLADPERMLCSDCV